MPWTYQQSTGCFTDPTGTLQGKGYSGQPPFKNDPAAQDKKDFGPIPCGLWYGMEMIPETQQHGPFVIRLESSGHDDTFGRSGFLIHGDSIAKPGFASEGCIVQSRDVRELFWASTDHDVQVIA